MNSPVTSSLTNNFETQAAESIKKYTGEINVDKSITFHKYENDLPIDIRKSMMIIKTGNISNLLKNIFQGEILDPIDEMNELYISCIGAAGSDKVFESKHIDGPFCILPFCTVVRTIVAIKGNSSIFTHFPMFHKKYNLLSNEFIIFDYNRHIHYIEKDTIICDDTDRIILKLHYIITPNFLPRHIAIFYKNIHIKYNSTMRTLFLNSQYQNGTLSTIINTGTDIYCGIYQYVGIYNIFIIMITLFLWR